MDNKMFSEQNQTIIENHLKSLEYEFTDDQKSAIIISLYSIANSDNYYHEKEKEFLKRIADIIGYDLDELISLSNENIKSDEVFQILSDFDEGEKDWYIITAFIMIYADGIALMDEYLQLEKYFKKMKISKDRWEEVISKTKEFLKL